MFFILSKTLHYLTMPLTIICLCFVTSLIFRNELWKKRLRWAGIIMLFFFTNEFIANEFMRAWEIETVAYIDLKPHKLGIVLTGATLPDRDPNDRVYFHRGADRVIHTVQLYKAGLLEKILISGGSGRLVYEEEPEADKFKKVMVLMGVPEEVILIENETRNTAESAIEVQRILKQLNYESSSCLLITSAFHMRRSLATYKKAGLDLQSFSTDFYSYPRVFYLDTLIIPKLDALIVWHKLTKEWSGFIAYKFAGYI